MQLGCYSHAKNHKICANKRADIYAPQCFRVYLYLCAWRFCWFGLEGGWDCFRFCFFVVALRFTLYITLLESDNALKKKKPPQTCILVVNYISNFLEHLFRLFFSRQIMFLRKNTTEVVPCMSSLNHQWPSITYFQNRSVLIRNNWTGSA